ncbi:ABC transporter permease [Spiroplasma eriocheiris]|uniref:ABC transporter permease n=1 Tax=Spiroplasma eriocheiris TaxID=315358 RepID=UPI0009C3CBF9|nr:hypothetical protein [Spiroplasma eriocheiris]AHF58186.1 putative transmembrane protein [Spiroplasma eriocheiris CCTCC M 207170]
MLKKVYWSDYKSKLLSVTNYFISDAQASQKINTHIQGKEFGTYGYGLGLYFISISLWVGAMLQTFIYSKKSYTKNAKWHQYYLAKWVTMIMTSYAQVLLLFIGLLAVGYGNLGSPILYMLMWMVITATVLTTITQALWYCLPDVNSGRFLCIMYTVFNLAAGGGSFPAILQNKFFEGISYIVPFTYTIRGLSNIVYGVASNEGIISNYNDQILSSFGIICLFFAFFLALGLATSYVYRRIDIYGTFKLKEIYLAMNNINETENFAQSRRVINNLDIKYTTLIKEYIDKINRNKKIKLLEDKISNLYKDPAVVRIKKLESNLVTLRDRFEIINQRYNILSQKVEITNSAHDQKKVTKLKRKINKLVEKIKKDRQEIMELKANPNIERIRSLTAKYNTMKTEYDTLASGNTSDWKVKVKGIKLKQELIYTKKKIADLTASTTKTLFDSPNEVKINKLIIEYNIIKEQLNDLQRNNKATEHLTKKYENKLLKIKDQVTALKESSLIINRFIEEKIIKLNKQLETINIEKAKNQKLASLMKDDNYNIKVKKANHKISEIVNEIQVLEEELKSIVEHQKDRIKNKYKYNKYLMNLTRIKSNYVYDDAREGIA